MHQNTRPPKKKLKKETLETLTTEITTDPIAIVKHPIVAIALIVGAVYVTLYASKYFITAAAQTIKACKDFNHEWKK